jgi:lysine-N-methylase
MSYTKIFIVPNYYKNFTCKGHDCRRSCCKGWDVSISMIEYFKLSGMNCSKKLRKRLDNAFYIAKNPTNDRYAIVSKTIEDDCPLHMSNGYCMLQYECGERILPAICHYYP